MKVWIAGAEYGGGSIIPAKDAKISVLDHGITVGDGVFETVKACEGTGFALTRHLRRLARSATGLGLPEPDLGLLASGVRQVLDANAEIDPARVRITVTGGPGPLSSHRGDQGLTYLVAVNAFTEPAAQVDVAIAPWTRNENGALAGLKTTSYAENVLALQFAAQRGADEALFANTAGNLCEGTGSNIFLVLDGELFTPPLSSGALAGITRELVLEWYGAKENDLPMTALTNATEAFLAGSGRNIQPIRAVDGQALAESPGSITSEVAKVFAERSAADMDP